MELTIKQGDRRPVTFTVNHDLTGATTRLLCRHRARLGPLKELEHDVTDAAAGTVTHTLDGTWEVGRHYIELEITQGDEVRTAPSADYLTLWVVADLDLH